MTNELPARLYGPGLPAGGVETTLSLSDERLRFALPDGTGGEVACAAVDFARAGFDERSLALRWHDGTGAWEAQLAPPAAASLLAAPPPAWAQRLQSLRARAGRTARRRAWGWGAVALVLGAPLIALLVFVLNAGSIAAWAIRDIDIEQEVELGKQAFESMRPRLKLRDESEAQRVVAEIGARLTQGSRYSYRWHVADDPSVNAFALPGGIVVVHSGLIAASGDAEELAGVLAHEVEHVELRHSLRNMVQGLGLRALMSIALGDWGGAVGSIAADMTELKFSRDAESEADAAGHARLVARAIDPSGMERFFAKMAARDGSGIALLSSHPASEARMQAMAALAAQAPRREYVRLPYAWPPASGK